MCWFIKANKKPVPRIAKRNITCYKYGILDKLKTNETDDGKEKEYFKSGVYFSCYNFGEVAQAWDIEVDEFIEKLKILEIESTKGVNYYEVDGGIHSCKNPIETVGTSVCVKCVIPKGAEYLYNPFREEYVSTKIIVQKRV